MGSVVSSMPADDFSGHTNSSPLISSSSPSNQPDTHIPKKPRLSLFNQALRLFGSSRLFQYPQTKPQLKRSVHAPCCAHRFGPASNFSKEARNWPIGIGEGLFGYTMGNILRVERKRKVAREGILQAVQGLKKEPVKESQDTFEAPSDEVIENVEGKKGCGSEASGHRLQEADGLTLSSWKFDERPLEDGVVLVSSSEVSCITKLEDTDNMLNSLSLSTDCYKSLGLEKKQEERVEDVDSAHFIEPFLPLDKEELEAVAKAFSNSHRRKVLVSHESSNIEITGQVLLCLRPGAWLNDEVINLYLELLKEREDREPKKFLRCHFFNTFFYKKLIGGGSGYAYKSVRRWTSEKKLGYVLNECDKIFVPIHKEAHWCLAVINKKDQKFQYLDSLGGKDSQVLKDLARYFVEEVKDKTGQDIDVTSWELEFIEDLPAQENGFDCGVFIIKYADFCSRGIGLNFSQKHMPYFRLLTAKEILQLRAD